MPDRPNVLILMPDQFRADAMGCAGHPVFRTPNLDRLAQEGARFTRAYATSPLCMPARASVMSGTYPHNHHIQGNSGQVPADDESFAQLVQRAGYHTAYIGKSHFYAHGRGVDMVDYEPYMHARGWAYVHETPGPMASVNTRSYLSRYWEERGLWRVYQEDYARRAQEGGAVAVWPSPLPEEDFMDSYVAARAVEWLQQLDASRPFCAWVAFGGPHTPWDAPGHYATMYDPAEVPDPIPAPEPPEWLPAYVRERMLAGRDERFTPEVSRRCMANYGGKVTLIDDCIGRILHALEARGLAENTLVIFWSDHGEMGGDHLRHSKVVFYDSSARIPMIVRWPAAIRGGLVSEALVEQIDVFGTVTEAAGAASERAFAKSLLPLARGETERLHDAVFSEVHRTVMIRDDRFKYAVDPQGRGYQLHDMPADPLEQRNLIGHPDFGGVEQDLRERLLTWLITTQVERR